MGGESVSEGTLPSSLGCKRRRCAFKLVRFGYLPLTINVVLVMVSVYCLEGLQYMYMNNCVCARTPTVYMYVMYM